MAIITEEIKEQILKVRATGLVNMLDINGVQRVAFDNDFYELVCLIEEDKQAYVNFILHKKPEQGVILEK